MMGHYVYNKTLTGAKNMATSQCFNENQLKGICAVWLEKKNLNINLKQHYMAKESFVIEHKRLRWTQQFENSLFQVMQSV